MGLVAIFGPPVGAALAGPKIDVVVLKNGDRITCEIKKLDRARLTLSTDAMDTVTVHWDTVGQVVSPRGFEVELTSGQIFYGSLAAGPPGQLGLVARDGSLTPFALGTVIRLTPLGTSFWGRMDGTIDLGFSFNQAELETRWTLNSSATYSTRRYTFRGSLSSQLTSREDADELSRHALNLSGNRLLGQRWFSLALLQFQRNEELSLDLRALAGAGFGRYFTKSNRSLSSAYSGIAYTRERFAGEPLQSSAEAVVGGALEFFSPGDNDFTFTNSLSSFYRLGSEGRVRLEFESALRHEFFKDFYWSINGFDSFDSAPPDGGKQNDAGVSLALGWKF